MNQVTYEIPPTTERVSRWTRRERWLLALVVMLGVAVALLAAYHHVSPRLVAGIAAAASALLFGANTVTYETPVTGVTAPTAPQSRPHQQVSAVITGDGAATTFVVTHNWNLSAADLASGWAEVELEYLLAAGYTAAALITSKTANAVNFSCTAFTGAGLRVRVKRPWTPGR